MDLELSRINELHALHTIYNLAPKTFLQITSLRKIRMSRKKQEARLAEIVEGLRAEQYAIVPS